MAFKAIIDLVLLGVLIICVWSGYKKGIIMGVGGILCIIVAVYGANLLANSFSYDVVPALKPFANGYTETMMNGSDSTVMKRMGWEGSTYRVEDLVEMVKLGVMQVPALMVDGRLLFAGRVPDVKAICRALEKALS